MNPSTQITIAKLIETPWFKKLPILRLVVASMVAEDEKGKEEEPKRLNTFHLISLSKSFDLSPLFEQGGGRRKEGMRFMTKELTSRMISRLEGVAARAVGRYRVMKSGPTGVRLEGKELGRKGRLVVVVEIFAVAPSVLMVVIRKDTGDTLEYRSFYINELRPAIQDIV